MADQPERDEPPGDNAADQAERERGDSAADQAERDAPAVEALLGVQEERRTFFQ